VARAVLSPSRYRAPATGEVGDCLRRWPARPGLRRSHPSGAIEEGTEARGDRGHRVAWVGRAPRFFGGRAPQRGLATFGGAIVGRFMLPRPHGLIVIGLFEKLDRAGALLARGTHGVPCRFRALARERVVPWATRRSVPPPLPRAVVPPVVSAPGAMPTSVLAVNPGDWVAGATDEADDGVADDEGLAAPSPVSIVDLWGAEHDSSPAQTSGPSRTLAVIRLTAASVYTVPPGCGRCQTSAAGGRYR